MMSPTMNGKVPASTPAANQPMPLPRLETTTAAPNAPVSSAVAVSKLRPEIIIPALSIPAACKHKAAARLSVSDEPALVGGDLAGALDVLLDEPAEGVAG